MSYRCGSCKKTQPNGESPSKVVTKIIKKRYLHRGGAESFGWEIEEELDLCVSCEGRVALVEVAAREAVKGTLYRAPETLTHNMSLGRASA